MGDFVFDGVVLAIVLIVACAATAIIGNVDGKRATMQQAFERGYAVQCIGKTGYHWECGE